MWWKKLLYAIGALIIGAGTTAIVMTASFHSTFVEIAENAVKNKDYDLSQSFYYYVSSKNSDRFLTKNFEDGVHLEVQPIITKQPHYSYSDYEQKMVVDYETIEEGIGFSLFHLPKTFDLSSNGKNAGITIVFDNSNSVTLPFNNEGVEKGSINYNINFTEYSKAYSFMPNSIVRSDYIASSLDENAKITKIDIHDDKGVVQYTHTFVETYPHLSEKLHSIFGETLDKFNEESRSYYEHINVQTLERKQALERKIKELVETNKSKIIPMQSETIVLQSDKMVIAVSLTIAIYVTVAIIFGNFLFSFSKRKGIYKNIPKKDGNHLSIK